MLCNICGYSGDDFFSSELNEFPDFIGLGKRKNERCPHCNSKDRFRLIRYYLERNSIGKNTFDISPASAALEHWCRAHSENYIVNNYPTLKIVDGGGRETCYNIEDLSAFEDNYFDMIICSHVLEHVTHINNAISELLRVLKDDGRLLILIPINIKQQSLEEDLPESDKIKLYGQEDHVRRFGYDWKEKYFQDIHIDIYSPSIADREFYALGDESIYIVRKKK